ncbi:hypothetical protein ACSQ5K_15095 [Pseudomonas sp. PhalM4]
MSQSERPSPATCPADTEYQPAEERMVYSLLKLGEPYRYKRVFFMGDTSALSRLMEATPRLLKFLIKTRPGRTIIIFSALLTSFALGAKYGHDTSPKYLTKYAAITFLINNANYEKTDLLPDTFTLKAGVYEYKYSLKTNTVTKNVSSPAEFIGNTWPARWDEEAFSNAISTLEALTPPTAATAIVETALSKTLKKIGSAAEPVAERVTGVQRVFFYLAVAVIGGTGGYLGYKLTYDPDDHLSDDEMIKSLMDPDSWRSFALEISNCELIAKTQEVRAAIQKTTKPEQNNPERSVQKAIELQSVPEKILDCKARLNSLREQNNKHK